MAGHCSRFAIAPEIEQLMITGSSNELTRSYLPPHRWRTRSGAAYAGCSSYRHHPVLSPRPLDLLVLRHPQSRDDPRTRLSRVDDVVDHRVARGDIDVDLLADRF